MSKKPIKKQVKQPAKVDVHPVYGIFFIIAVTIAATTIVNFLIWQYIS